MIETEIHSCLSRKDSLNKTCKNAKKRKKRKSKFWKRSNYLKRRIEYEFKKRKRHKKSSNNNQGANFWLPPIRPSVFESIVAPSRFSLINNTEEVLDYFKRVRKLLYNRKQVNFDLASIDELTPDAIALLIAKVKDKRFTRNISVQGNRPEKKELKRIFEESGFLNHVKSEYIPPNNENNLLFHQVTHKKVDPELAKKVSLLAVKHTFKNETKFSPIYKIMIECMANTDNHASTVKEGEYDWWLFSYCDPKNNVTSFTFLDLGVGIFNSNPVNNYKREILTKISKLTTIDLTSNNNLKIVPQLFSGSIYTSRTKNKKRGQGLPSIKECAENNKICNFIIITNNVKIYIPSLKCEALKNKFMGTLLYWELHP